MKDKKIVKKNRMSFKEGVVMNALYKIGKPASCAEVMEVLENDYGLKYKDTTVYTFLANIQDKELVKVELGRVKKYVPLIDREILLNESLETIKNLWFDGSLAAMKNYINKLDS